MDKELFDICKGELMKDVNKPYRIHNKELAKAFFAELVKEITTARLFVFPDSQAITCNAEAESNLIKDIQSKQDALMKQLLALEAMKEQIQGGN